MGFNDGVSNPDRLQNDVIWTTEIDEKKELEMDHTWFSRR